MSRQEAVERPLRADAARNRERLLQAARELFAERGLDVTLDDVAHHAGVGVGTAYRRFASKDDLIDALFDEELARIVAVADAAAAHDDPWEGLVYWIEHLVEMQTSNRGLKTVMTSSSRGKDRVAAGRAQIGPRILPLVVRAREAGVVRPDLQPSDIPMVVFMVTSAAEYTRAVDPEVWRRYLAIALDGLRGATPLPRDALNLREVTECMGRWR